MTHVAKKMPNRQQELIWVERVASHFAEKNGLPLITGRILGWLLICDPAEQSAGVIAEAIGASRASITTGMRLLTATQLVRSLTRPGDRTIYYRIDDDSWEKMIRRRLESIAAFREVTREGMDLVGAKSPRASRIRAAHEIYEWAAAIFNNAPGPMSTKQTE